MEIFSRPQVLKILGNIGFSEQMFYRKQSLGGAEKIQSIDCTHCGNSP